MSERFSFDEQFVPVPPAAIDADPSAAIKHLLYRVARLEQSLEEERLRGVSDTRELLLDLISFYDDITATIERWGVATRAQDAATVGSLVALGRKLIAVLKQHQVAAISTLGEPLDPETSDVVGTEVHEGMAPNVVVREVRAGYTSPLGLLRRAQVVVNAAPVASDAPEGEADSAREGAL